MDISIGKTVYAIEPIGGRAWGMAFETKPILLKATIIDILESLDTPPIPISVKLTIDQNSPGLKRLDEDFDYKEVMVDVDRIFETPSLAISAFMSESQKYLNQQRKEMK